MEKKFTPGPWFISNPTYKGAWSGFATYKGECRGIYATNDDLEAIALVPKDYLLMAKDQDYEANAKLIAAAPEMLQALLDWQAANALGDAQLLYQSRITRDIAIKKALE